MSNSTGASTLREQLQAIYDQHGFLTPRLVLDTARNPDHPLHTRFTWDNEAAGEAHRLNEARGLIRSVRVVYKEADDKEAARSVRAWHAVRAPEGHVFEPTEQIAGNPLLRQMVMRDMEREWQQLKRRYAHFGEFLEMVRKDVGDEAA